MSAILRSAAWAASPATPNDRPAARTAPARNFFTHASPTPSALLWLNREPRGPQGLGGSGGHHPRSSGLRQPSISRLVNRRIGCAAAGERESLYLPKLHGIFFCSTPPPR